MIRYLSVAALVAVGATVTWAQNLDAIKERRLSMRAIASDSGALSKIAKGESPFDSAKVQAGFKAMESNATKFKTLFPTDAKTGGATDASPKIWTERAVFDGALDKWIAVMRAAEAGSKDLESFKAEYSKVASGCGGCHKTADGFAPRVGEVVRKPPP